VLSAARYPLAVGRAYSAADGVAPLGAYDVPELNPQNRACHRSAAATMAAYFRSLSEMPEIPPIWLSLAKTSVRPIPTRNSVGAPEEPSTARYQSSHIPRLRKSGMRVVITTEGRGAQRSADW